MKKSPFCVLAAALLCCSCAAPSRCRITASELVPGVPEYTMNNGILEIKVLAGVSGIVNGFEYLPDTRQFCEPIKYNVKKHDLLPDEINASVTGGRELVWGIKNFVNVPLTVNSVTDTPEKSFLSMSTRYFQGENIRADKTVTLHAGTLDVDVEFVLYNSTAKVQSMSLWKLFNAQFTPGKRDLVLIPAKSGIDRVGRRAVIKMAEDCIFHDFAPTHQTCFIAPLANWIARTSSDGVNRGTFAMSVDGMLAPGAFFYTWKHTVLPLHTTEMVLPPENLAPGAKKSYRIRYFFFPHLAALRAISGNFGIDVENDNTLAVESVRHTSAESWQLFRRENGSWTHFQSVDIPALAPGKICRVKLDLPSKDADALQIIRPGNIKVYLPKILKKEK